MSLSSTEWKLVRAQVIQRDNSTCVECGIPAESEDVDVHHLLPRSAGGADDPSNLVTLCDGCHAAHHPKLAGSLARRAMECWAVRLARWLDREGEVVPESQAFGPLLRLFGLDRFKEGQLPIIQAALTGRSLLVVSPTGFGKTLCFQLPAVVRKSVSIVVSPLKALMGEQVSSLLRRKIPASFIAASHSALTKPSIGKDPFHNSRGYAFSHRLLRPFEIADQRRAEAGIVAGHFSHGSDLIMFVSQR